MTVLRLTVLVWLACLQACGGGGGGSGAATLRSESAVTASSAATTSYYGDTKLILDARCLGCHQPGGAAPLSFVDYEDLPGYRSALIYAVESRTMPPPGYAPLTDRERDTLLSWMLDNKMARGEPDQLPGTPYSWWGDVRDIVARRCGICHVEEGLAPFPLQDYQDVAAIGAAALYSINNDTMPPWNPTPGYTAMDQDLSLTRQEKAILVDWLAGGAPEGAARTLPPSVGTGLEQVAWDFSLRMSEPYTPVVLPDEYRCFVLDWPLDQTRYITAVTLQPEVEQEIHHSFATIIAPHDVARYKAAEGHDGRPGYSCFGDTRLPGELPTTPPADIMNWSPGLNSLRLPAGTGIKIEPGSAIALQIHFNTLTIEPAPEQSELTFVTTENVERPGTSAYILDIANWIFDNKLFIPAGEDDVSFQYEMPAIELTSIFTRPEMGIGPNDPIAIHRANPHMHTLGKSTRLTLVRPDGSEQVIVDAARWDFDWQNNYILTEEVIVRPEDRIRIQCVYNNTQANQAIVDGRRLPMQDVRWGNGTADEMCVQTVYFTRVKNMREPQASVYIGNPAPWQSYAPGKLMPVELRLNNFVLEEPAAHGEAHQHAPHSHGAARRGHYHLYFDSDDDAAEHVTDWRQRPVVAVPESMAPGIHRLRVSLRDEHHQAIGIEDSVDFRVSPGSPPRQATTLIDHDAWLVRGESLDPFMEHRPAVVDCPASAARREGAALEIQTGICNYLALRQPLLADLRAGDKIRVVLWHQQLRSGQSGRGHAALALGGEPLWEQGVAIPSDGQFYENIISVAGDYPAGTALDFHLHNHGYNSWTLLSIERLD